MQIDASGWIDTAIGIYYPDKSMPRGAYKPTHVVLHGTAGGSSAENIAAYFRDSSVDASSHIVIGQDGHVVQGISCDSAAWGNGVLNNPRLPFPADVNPNLYTISIEHVKPSDDNSDSLTDAQKQASFQVINLLCDHYAIPKRKGDWTGGIVEHADFDSVDRARCPGLYPWTELLAFLQGGATMAGVPNGWKDDGTTLTVPNGIQVTQGFRAWVLAQNWDAGNWPLMNAVGLNPVEVGNPSIGGGTVQPFRKTVLVWTQKTGIYEMWTGQEYVALYQRAHNADVQVASATSQVTTLQARIAALQAQIAQTPPNDTQVSDLKQRLTQINTLSKIGG